MDVKPVTVTSGGKIVLTKRVESIGKENGICMREEYYLRRS